MATTTKDRRNSKSIPGLNITNDERVRDIVSRHKELKQIERAAAEAERERKVLEAELRELMGDEEQIVIRGVVVAKLSSQRHTTKTDLTTLKLAYPEAFSQCVSRVGYRFVQVL